MKEYYKNLREHNTQKYSKMKNGFLQLSKFVIFLGNICFIKIQKYLTLRNNLNIELKKGRKNARVRCAVITPAWKKKLSLKKKSLPESSVLIFKSCKIFQLILLKNSSLIKKSYNYDIKNTVRASPFFSTLIRSCHSNGWGL